jgi:hypothetical protein
MSGAGDPSGGRRQATVAPAAMAAVSLVTVVQWALLSVAVEGYRTGQVDLLAGSSLASFLCLAAAWRLTRYDR